MDYETFQDVAKTVSRLKMFPYCDLAHYIICALTVKDETHLLEGGAFTRKHPFASWVATLFVCFAGKILSAFLLGEPPITALKNEDDILLASAVWYVLNYAPFDIVYRIVKMLPVKCLVYTLKELNRTKKIADGVEHAAHAFPDAHLIIVAVGVAKSVGSELCAGVTAHFYGAPLSTSGNRYLFPSFAFKLSIIASLAFLFHTEPKEFDFLPEAFVNASYSEVYFSVFIFLASLKLATLLMHASDPFRPIENVICAFMFGGFVDALRKALIAQPMPAPGATGVQQGVASQPRHLQPAAAAPQNAAANNSLNASQAHNAAASKQSTVTPPTNTPPATPTTPIADTKDGKKI